MDGIFGIITSGGGVRCSYSAGVLLGLIEKFPAHKPDIMIGASGSAGTNMYYVAGQHDVIYDVWTKGVASKDFIDTRRVRRMIDIDYLVDEIFKSQNPLQKAGLLSSKTNYFVPATNAKTAQVRHFHDWKNVDVYEVLRAAKALPLSFLYGQRVDVNGTSYVDTYNSASIQTNIQKAVQEGATKILVIDNDPPNLFNEAIFLAWLLAQTREFRTNYLNIRAARRKFTLPGNVDCYFMRPQTPLKIKTLSNDRFLFEATVDQGYREAVSDQELARFLEK